MPAEIRRLLGLKSGDKILFYQKQDGEVVLSNASAQAIRKVQSAFSGAAEAMGISGEDDVRALVDEVRYGKDQPILNVAIVSDVDIILTGDKDFLSLEMEHPRCMTVTQFLENEGVEE